MQFGCHNDQGVCPDLSGRGPLEFVNPTTGTHTQHVESYWGRVKKRFKSMKGVHAEQLPSYLDEFMWRERYITDLNLAFDSILAAIPSVVFIFKDM